MIKNKIRIKKQNEQKEENGNINILEKVLQQQKMINEFNRQSVQM
jgi:hypothetical protein